MRKRSERGYSGMRVRGSPGLRFERGGGGSQPFFPASLAHSSAEVQRIVGQAPQHFGIERSRWWLEGIRTQVAWMKQLSLPGIHGLLRKFKIVYKRGRHYVHSPDPEYEPKMARIAEVWRFVRSSPEQYVLLYEDELSYYRQPTVAQSYAPEGSKDPRAIRSHRSNVYRRLAGCLNALTGQVIAWDRSRFDRKTLLAFFLAVEKAYPKATTIFIILDNWPVHFHEDILAGLAGSKIQLIRLPTYAPWTNPIEKLWRKLYQEVLHLHQQSNEWDKLQSRVASFLDRLKAPSPDLLAYVGLAD